MFFLLVLTAVIGFSLQSTLMVSYYRRIDPLFAITLRSLAVGVCLIPLLFFVSKDELEIAGNFFLPILAAGAALVFANWARGVAYTMLPVGIVVALCQSITAIILLYLGGLFLNDVISTDEFFWVALLLIGILCLGISKSHGAVPVRLRPFNGFLLCLTHSILIAGAILIVSQASRASHPFVVSFLWEILAGVLGIVLTYVRGKFSISIFKQIGQRDIPKVLLYCTPAAIGLACFVHSFRLGPVAIASSILTANMTVSALLAYWIYAEKLTRKQIVLILFIWGQVIGLKLAGGY